MHFITSTTLLAASAFLTLASPIQKKAGVSAFIGDPFKDIAYNPVVPAKGDIKDDPMKDITDNLIPIQDETANATKQLEARDCIFDLYFRGIPPFVLENTVVMDGCWNLAVAGGGLCCCLFRPLSLRLGGGHTLLLPLLPQLPCPVIFLL